MTNERIYWITLFVSTIIGLIGSKYGVFEPSNCLMYIMGYIGAYLFIR